MDLIIIFNTKHFNKLTFLKFIERLEAFENKLVKEALLQFKLLVYEVN